MQTPHFMKYGPIEKAALDLLRWLLERHPCVVSLEADYDDLNSGVLVETLARSSSLRRLTVHGFVKVDPPEVVDRPADADDRLAITEEIYSTSTARMENPVLLLGNHDAALVSLDFAILEMSPSTANILIEALVENGTVEELAVGDNVLVSEGGTFESFLQYLTKRNSVLRKLIFKVRYLDINIATLQTLARAICTVTTLQDLTWQGRAASLDCALFLAALAQSRTVRSLTFLLEETDGYFVQRSSETSSDPFWIAPLLENGTLLKLDLEVSWSCSEDCCLLLEALATTNTLESVTLRNFPNDDDGWRKVRRTVRELGLEQRVRLEGCPVFLKDDSTLSACERVTSIVVCSDDLTQDVPALRNAFHLIATCHYVTSMHVFLYDFDEATFALLSTYISESPTIGEIELKLHFCEGEESFIANREVAVESISNLFAALSSNTSVISMKVFSVIDIGEKDCRVLADAASNNRRLQELSVVGMKTSVHVFLDRLLLRLEKNYNLLLLQVPLCVKPSDRTLEAQELVRRNCSLVERATRFATGGDRSWYCACAFERVSEEPVLVNNVRRKLVTTSTQAEDMIRDARQFLRLMNVHDYMALTGVVKARVECNVQKDGRPQLDQLYHDCWLHIRQYLMVGDVVKH
ncbi:hypothetical protein HPB52_015474 [Rhipicephalus sanguineus]|uniref:Uncharacterized protein n=1 Tax=Rhipicephalus sanguineus TaxID=34632 RepID=A0A9D4SRL5_RHISA|nr:hypothetical protein HPB52_015474 [Rhipicephalus sanguineus]